MNPKFKCWLDCALASFVSGVANSFLLALGIGGAQMVGINIQALNARQLLATTLVGGLVGLARYLQKSPLPDRATPVDVVGTGSNSMTDMKTKLPFLLAVILTAALCAGCANALVPKTQFSGKVGGQPFSFSGPKDVSIGALSVMVATNGTISMTASNVTATMNPAVVQMSGEAFVNGVNAVGSQVINGVNAGAAAFSTGGASAPLKKP